MIFSSENFFEYGRSKKTREFLDAFLTAEACLIMISSSISLVLSIPYRTIPIESPTSITSTKSSIIFVKL